MVRTKLVQQVNNEKYSGALDIIQRVPAEEGEAKAMWEGSDAALMQLFIDELAPFLVTDLVKQLLARLGNWYWLSVTALCTPVAFAVRCFS
jgi:hypothetical protein